MAGSLVDEADGRSLVDPTPLRGGTIFLMRHGRTALDTEHRSDGWLDMPLSDDGQRELIDAQQVLKTTPITKIYTPDLKRTKETAELVKSGLMSDPKIVVDDAVKTWNLGVLAGTKKRYGRPEVQKLVANPESVPLGGESFNAFVNRFVPWFEKRGKEIAKGGCILIICSGSNLRLLGNYLLGDQEAVDLAEGGLAALWKQGGGWGGETLLGHEDDSENMSA